MVSNSRITRLRWCSGNGRECTSFPERSNLRTDRRVWSRRSTQSSPAPAMATGSPSSLGPGPRPPNAVMILPAESILIRWGAPELRIQSAPVSSSQTRLRIRVTSSRGGNSREISATMRLPSSPGAAPHDAASQTARQHEPRRGMAWNRMTVRALEWVSHPSPLLRETLVPAYLPDRLTSRTVLLAPS